MKLSQTGGISLPSNAEAIRIISRFTEIDPYAVDNYIMLARVLGGMSAALSVVSLDYGESHPIGGDNIGLWTEIGSGVDRHNFVVSSQDANGIGCASIRRIAIEGGFNNYVREISIPTDIALRQFTIMDPDSIYQNYLTDRPAREDVYALAATTDHGLQTIEEYWPFYLPVSRPEESPTTAAEDVVGYTRILQNLALTLIEIVQ
jgi:hypothetical protein